MKDREEQTGYGLIPDPERINTESGQYTATEKFNRAKEVSESYDRGEWSYTSAALDVGNTIYDVAETAYIDISNPDEEDFDYASLPGLFDDIPAMFHKELANTGNEVEAWATRANIQEYLTNLDRLEASGFKGTAATLAAGLIDADALLIPVSGGTYLGTKTALTLARLGVRDGRVASSIAGGAAGVEAGLVTGAAGAIGGTSTDVGDIPSMILGGMAFGSTIGAAVGKGATSPYSQMNSAGKARDEYLESMARGFVPAGTQMSEAGSVGSAKVRMVNTPTTLRDSTKPWFDRAADDTNAVNARKVLEGKEDAETTNVDEFIGRGAQKMQNWVDKSPLRSLYTSVSDMGWIGNKLSFDLLYHPGGIIDGSTPAAGYDALYTQDLSVPLQSYHGSVVKWLGRPTSGIKDKLNNAFIRKDDYRKFDRELQLELETRYHTKKGIEGQHEAITDIANKIDDMHARSISIQQGMAGETPVFGSENLKHRSGYYSRKWNGERIKQYDEDAVVNALSKGYMAVLPAGSVVDPKVLKSVVKSIVTRSKALDEGIDTNLVGLLRDGGKEFLRDTLKNNNLSDKDIDSVINAFTGSAKDRSKPGFLKDRIELDMRTKIEGTNDMLLDLLEPEMYKNLHRYTRKVSGASAMARKGYQLSDKTSIIESIKDEMVANGKRVDDSRIDDVLETVFSYFGEGSIGKGVDPLLLSAMRLTRQSLLGSLGLTQMNEVGNIVTMVGVEAAMKVMPKEMKSLVSGKKTPLVQEMHDAFMFMDKDHVLYDDQLALDIVGKDSVVQSEFMDGAHKAVAFGDKIAGYSSLFYQTLSWQQRVAVSGVNHKIYKALKGVNLDSGINSRLKDLGLDDELADTLQAYINKGTIRYEGDELTMDFKAWKPEDLQRYRLALNEFTARAVQKSLPGETSYWMTKQFGQAMTQFRSFPILAMQKQFLRNMRHADATTSASILWNLAVAGIIYSVAQTVKGRGDDLTPERIAKGAINYAPTTGWMPMVTDPLAEIMGMPELRMNKFGPPGRATDGIIPTPPVLPTMNRMAHIPGAAIGSLNGIDRNEASALGSIPIIGNLYGFSALFNYIKDN